MVKARLHRSQGRVEGLSDVWFVAWMKVEVLKQHRGLLFDIGPQGLVGRTVDKGVPIKRSKSIFSIYARNHDTFESGLHVHDTTCLLFSTRVLKLPVLTV
jgi:hypothetical protein